MPFQSEKQRRYMHANLPEIAKRWERDYGEGGIAALNAQLNQLPEYYLPAADGGNVRLGPHTATDLLAKKNPDGTRSKYQPPSQGGGFANVGGEGQGHPDRGWQTYAIEPPPPTPGGDGIHPIHQGPTTAEIDAQKKTIAAAKHKAWIDRKDKKKEKVEHHKKLDMGFNEFQKFGKGLMDFAPEYYANLANQNKIKEGKLDMGYNEFQKFGKGLMDFAPDYYANLEKVKDYKPSGPSMNVDTGQWYNAKGKPIDNPNINPELASMITPIGYIREDIKPKGTVEKSVYDYAIKPNIGAKEFKSWYDTLDAKPADKEFVNEIYKELQLSDKIEDAGGMEYVESLDIKGRNKFDDQRKAFDILSNKISTGKKEGKNTSNLKKDYLDNKDEYNDLGITNMGEFEILLEKTSIGVKEGGVARKNYFHGGILGLNESEEIISDDGNDIELTAYNAAFDDPNDLSTGVKSLFQAKDGGTPQLAKKSKDGKRPGYQGNPFGYEDAPAHHGDVAHGPGGRFDQPSAPTKKSSPVADYKGQHDWDVVTKPGEGEVVIDTGPKREEPYVMVGGQKVHQSLWGTTADPREKYDTEEQMLDGTYAFNPKGAVKKHTYLTGRTGAAYEKALADQKAKMKRMGLGKLLIGLVMLVAGIPPEMIMKQVMITRSDMQKVITASIPVMKAKKAHMTALGNAKADYEELGMADFHHAVDTEIQTIDQKLLDLTRTRDEDDPGPHDPLPKVVPIGEEIEAYAQSDYYMSPWERMKAHQARKANLVAKRIHTEYNPIVDESVTDITMQANSGGLANLFRVKNNQ